MNCFGGGSCGFCIFELLCLSRHLAVLLLGGGRDNVMYVGRGSSVGIATGYGLDGPGIDSGCERDLPHLSRPTLGPTQPPVQWVPALSRV